MALDPLHLMVETLWERTKKIRAAERMHLLPAMVRFDTTDETAFRAARRLSALTKAATSVSSSSGGP